MEPLSPARVRNAGFGLLTAIAMVAEHLRRQASAAVILLLVFGGGVLAWGFGSSPALRMSALGVAVGAFATIELLALKFGVPVPERPDPNSPTTLNLSSR